MFLNMPKGRTKNRCGLEIVGDMLSIALVKVRKTRIMYQANLSYVQLEKYLKFLLEGDLMQCDQDSCYLVTQKGRDFLKTYANYLERRSRVSKEVQGAARDKLLLEEMCFNSKNDSACCAVKKAVSE